MKRKTMFLFVFTLTIFMVNSLQAETKVSLTKITDSVYSYVGINPGTKGDVFLANAGIVIGSKAVLVVDTLTSKKEAEILFENIRKVTDKPILYVVNTHYHFDHSLGNSFFKDKNALIISHVKCWESALKSYNENSLKDPSMYGLPREFFEGTRIEFPAVTFEKEMQIDLGNKIVKLVHTGLSSHSMGSTVVLVPYDRVVFTGDILFTDFHPYLGEGDFTGWEKNLAYLKGLKYKHIIPGHGPLSTIKDIDDMSAYLKIFDEKAKALGKTEKDPQKLMEALLKVLPKRANGDFIVMMNIKTRYLKN